MTGNKVFTIAPGQDFLSQLVTALFSGQLNGVDCCDDDPFSLRNLRILLPTRRSARVLRERLLQRMGGQTAVLPDIRPLGDVDEESLFFENKDFEASGVSYNAETFFIKPAISTIERCLILARLVKHWQQQFSDSAENQLISHNIIGLAEDLGQLIDDVIIEDAKWQDLDNISPERLSDYWQLTRDFLQIATEMWPRILHDIGAIDTAERRNILLRLEVEHLAQYGSSVPIIAAGSTGSVNATSDLMAAINKIKNGSIILPGLDQQLDEASWDAIIVENEKSEILTTEEVTHPQYGLKKLLRRLDVERKDVIDLTSQDSSNTVCIRNKIISQCLRPATMTHLWHQDVAKVEDEAINNAFEHVALIEAVDEREEALSIAIILREICEDAQTTAAFVTPDRHLARRVRLELQRWQIDANDSAGTPLGQTQAGLFLNALCNLNPQEINPLNLLAILKHPLCVIGHSDVDMKQQISMLERALLRGNYISGGLINWLGAMASFDMRREHGAVADDLSQELTLNYAQKTLDENGWLQARTLLTMLEDIFSPLVQLFSKKEDISLAAYGQCLITIIDQLTCDEQGIIAGWQNDDGEALAAFLATIANDEKSGLTLSSSIIGNNLQQLMESVPVRMVTGSHPRIFIWGTLEARLQHVDRIIIGGLNEGNWPRQPQLDAFLSRPMRKVLGLSMPERSIGLSSHDFTQFCGMKSVFLTRSQKQGSTPTVASRWLQRLQTYMGKQYQTLSERGHYYIALSRRLTEVMEKDIRSVSQPNPKPPVHLRPVGLSVTEIERWIRDPYSLYVRHILKLRKFEALHPEPGAIDRGILIHQILHVFNQHIHSDGLTPNKYLPALLEIGHRYFSSLDAFPVEKQLWWERFKRVASWIVPYFYADGEQRIKQSWSEVRGKMIFNLPGVNFTLSGIADRIDILEGGHFSVIDYKTGMPPSKAQVGTLIAPQMPLEALMLYENAFPKLPKMKPGMITKLCYWQLSGGQPAGQIKNVTPNDGAEDLILQAHEKLSALIAQYADDKTGYPSRPRVMWEKFINGDYDHLARVLEWSRTGEDD